MFAGGPAVTAGVVADREHVREPMRRCEGHARDGVGREPIIQWCRDATVQSRLGLDVGTGLDGVAKVSLQVSSLV